MYLPIPADPGIDQSYYLLPKHEETLPVHVAVCKNDELNI